MRIGLVSYKREAGESWLILGGMHVMNDGWLASLPLLLPFIQKDLGFNYGRVGLLTSVLGSAGAIVALPAASVARRFGTLRVLAIAAALYSSCFFIAGAARTFEVLVLAFALASLGFGIFHPVSFARIALESKGERLGRRMGSFAAIGDIGRVGVGAAVTMLASLLTWRKAALLSGLVPMLLAAALWAFSRREAAPDAKAAERGEARGLPRGRAFVLALAAGFLDSLASSPLFAFLPLLFAYRGSPPALLGSLSSAFFVGTMAGKVAFGKLTDRWGNCRVFFLSEMAMAILLAALGATRNVALMAGLSVLLGSATKGTVPVLNTIIAESIDDKTLLERAFGMSSLVSSVSSILSPLLMGAITDRFGIVAMLQASACAAALAALPLLFRKRRRTGRSAASAGLPSSISPP